MRSIGLVAAAAELLVFFTAPAPASASLNRLAPPLPFQHLQVRTEGDSNNNNKRTPPPSSPGKLLGIDFFQQLIDHNNPSLGTFSQRYSWSAEWYKPGAPVVLTTPGETAIDGLEEVFVTNLSMPGVLGQNIRGAVVNLEHRYYGDSSPYKLQTTTNLQQLTVDNAAKDLVYFAQHVKLPFDPKGTSKPNKAPWILTGCSYAGALAAWVDALLPGVFWAYQAQSAVVQAREKLFQSWGEIKQAMPQNCSADLVQVMAKVDKTLLKGTKKEIKALKDRFLLGGLDYDIDFASALTDGPVTWQGMYMAGGYQGFHRFCDYVENQWPGSTAKAPGPKGVGVDKALDGYAKWFREVNLPGSCAKYGYSNETLGVDCYKSRDFDNPIFRDLSPRNTGNRQFAWLTCNEPFKWWRTGGPPGRIVSQLMDLEYLEDPCRLLFPREGKNTFGIDRGRTVDDFNRFVKGGWNHKFSKRVMFTIGEWDHTRPATLFARDFPGGPVKGTDDNPLFILPKSSHCGDINADNRYANPEYEKIWDGEIAYIKKWASEFYKEKGIPDPRK